LGALIVCGPSRFGVQAPFWCVHADHLRQISCREKTRICRTSCEGAAVAPGAFPSLPEEGVAWSDLEGALVQPWRRRPTTPIDGFTCRRESALEEPAPSPLFGRASSAEHMLLSRSRHPGLGFCDGRGTPFPRHPYYPSYREVPRGTGDRLVPPEARH
jgi:hypothetical protein